jgi:hypothetical protein
MRTGVGDCQAARSALVAARRALVERGKVRFVRTRLQRALGRTELAGAISTHRIRQLVVIVPFSGDFAALFIYLLSFAR